MGGVYGVFKGGGGIVCGMYIKQSHKTYIHFKYTLYTNIYTPHIHTLYTHYNHTLYIP